jgi:PPK2 family polyphosphate:nucleotide phosphotransferase
MAKSVRDRLLWNGTLPDPSDTPGVKGRSDARKDGAKMAPELADLQERLFANGKVGSNRRLLLLLQGMDASGKDGTVKHVVGQVNPAGCRITSFGAPTKEELSHDFLWRITNALPAAGQLGVFNRSHYEDVLIVRVHDLVPRATWSRRYARINTWEKRVASQGTTIVKVFLHISKDEQKQRLLKRLDDPRKHWKIGTADIPERAYWDDYQEAYLAALGKCSTDVAPWYVVPADHKWYRDWAVSSIILETLRDLDLAWPKREDLDLQAMRKQLKNEPR